jgi:hypothetical protein
MKIVHAEFRYHFQVLILSNEAFVTLYIHKKQNNTFLFPICKAVPVHTTKAYRGSSVQLHLILTTYTLYLPSFVLCWQKKHIGYNEVLNRELNSLSYTVLLTLVVSSFPYDITNAFIYVLRLTYSQ